MGTEHPICCDCLECMGGQSWPGAGATVSAEEHVRRTASAGKCVNGHPLTLGNRLMRRGKLSFECRECRRQYNASYYAARRLGRAPKREFKSGMRFV